MHDVCENSERYDCKNVRWIKKTMQCMSYSICAVHEKTDRLKT